MNHTVNTNDNTNIVHRKFRLGILVRTFHKIKVLIERRNTIRQLNALSDRMLHDIGISRENIHSSVNNRATFVKLSSSQANQANQSNKTEDFRRAA